MCIGSGGSVGREGPIVQIGSALGSLLGQATKVSETHLRLLVARGAAGGISATFNAPIAGVFFSLELILRNFETQSFGLVVLSSVTADAIGRAFFRQSPVPVTTFLQLQLAAGAIAIRRARRIAGHGGRAGLHTRALQRGGHRRPAVARP
ncbi:MAG: chloride channel protein [Solirubrobacterales bacterium]|nr:chloride channel protein [Solirubrobacterales bacterium]